MQDIFNSLKKLGTTLYVSAAGGGSEAISGISAYPSRSSVILGANFINCTNLFNQFVGVTEWTKYASMQSAEKLALKSQEIGNFGRNHVGIGIAASLATVNERVGRDNLFNICAIGYNFKISKTVRFELGHSDDTSRRIFQETIIRDNLCSLIEIVKHMLSYGIESASEEAFLLDFKIQYVPHLPEIKEESINIYPGSFNPIHDGHKYIAERSEVITGAKTYYELSLLNYEKNPIDFGVFSQRVEQINRETILTYKKTFVEKYKFLKEQYPHLKLINFICGIDTFDRIQYEDLDWFLEQKDVKFIVWGRNGRWIERLPWVTYVNLIHHNAELAEYDNTISSSEIRLKNNQT